MIRMACCTPKEFDAAWPKIRHKFTEIPDRPGRLTTVRVEEVFAECGYDREQKSRAGKLSAESRREKRQALASTPVEHPLKRTSAKCSNKLELQLEKTITPCSSCDERGAAEPSKQKPSDEIKAWFDNEFWPAYPRKVAKPQALRAARRHGKASADRVAILGCLRRRLPALQAQLRADGDFRPYPATWLDQTPWLDAEDTAAAGTAPRIEYFDASYLKDDSD
jgi:ribosomal protein L44E